MAKKLDTATLAGGCFWCTEAIYQRLEGVDSVIPGYSGGKIKNPTYELVCRGDTGYAEALQIKYDPGVISYTQILEVFWHIHDPTTVNRQGKDIGSQYRSVIFYHDREQKHTAQELKAEIGAKKLYPDPIVTEIVPYENFYKAEEYHYNYFEKHRESIYCNLVISPKIRKVFSKYRNLIKKGYLKAAY